MNSLFTDQINQIISFLELGQSTYTISSSTGVNPFTISHIHSKHYFNLAKFSRGWPSVIITTDMQHAIMTHAESARHMPDHQIGLKSDCNEGTKYEFHTMG